MGKKRRWGEIDFWLLATILLLVVIGVSSVYSASYNVAYFRTGDSGFYLFRQGMFAVLGIIAMIIVMQIDYHKYNNQRLMVLLIGFTIVLLIVVLFMPPVNGARRWIDLGVTTVQPSEIAKYVVVLTLAKVLENKSHKMDKVSTLVVALGIAGVFAGLVIIEPNMSIASVILIVSGVMIVMAGAKWSHIFTLLIGGVAGLAAMIAIAPYRMKRFTSFLNPWADPKGDGYQLIQSLYALASGGILGVGLGNSRQKMMYIPEPHNDFIFAIIGEELGLIGCIALIAIYCFFIYRGFKVALRAKDTYGSLLAIGITSVIAVQAMVNIAVVTGSMPVTGVPLPFISYGGSALVFNLIAMGILLNISRQSRMKN